jgi:hypothetical protein
MRIFGAAKYIMGAALVLAGTGAQAMGGQRVSVGFFSPQVRDDLFAGADKFSHGAKSTTEVNLDRKMLGMAAKFAGSYSDDKDDKDDKDDAKLVNKLEFVIVRSYEYEKPGQYNMADVEEFQKRLESGGWSHIVKARSATESTDVCVKTDDNGAFSELVVISAEPTELTFVHLKGHMTMDELTKAGAKYGVPQAATEDDETRRKKAK